MPLLPFIAPLYDTPIPLDQLDPHRLTGRWAPLCHPLNSRSQRGRVFPHPWGAVTAALLLIEVVALVVHRRPGRLGVFLVNLSVVVYLLRNLLRHGAAQASGGCVSGGGSGAGA